MSSLARPDSPLKLRGGAVYGTDLEVPGMLWGVLGALPRRGGTGAVDRFDRGTTDSRGGGGRTRRGIAASPARWGGSGADPSSPTEKSVTSTSRWLRSPPLPSKEPDARPLRCD